ncbi:MAG: GNAT family N-acetyltransferase [Planctomycetia bacterium]|nr:GNAT family N-acetyltransferase [Planctomycetia bacterium]
MTEPADTSILLETQRLVLRRFTESDAPLLFELDSDPEVMRFVGKFGLPSVEAYRERIRDVWMPYSAHPARGFWAVIEKASREFIGWIVLRPAPDYRFATQAGWTRASDLELGYRLRRSAWGRGLATEVAKELVCSALEDPAVTCVVAAALITNRASIRVLEKAGLRYVRDFAIPGFGDPSVMYAICRTGCQPP